jgi:diaminopimelate decarboxylase
VIRYAQKACSNLSILKLMQEDGLFVDAVSLGEIERAHRAGYTANSDGAAEIVSADIFDRRTLDRVLADRIEVNVGSIDMLHQIGELAPGHRVWIRINPGFGHGHSKKTNTGGESSKHGIWYTELRDAVGLVKRYGLHLVGLHMHIGSGVDYCHLEKVCEAMTGLLQEVDCDFEATPQAGGCQCLIARERKRSTRTITSSSGMRFARMQSAMLVIQYDSRSSQDASWLPSRG